MEPLFLPRSSLSWEKKTTPSEASIKGHRGHEHSMREPTPHNITDEQERLDHGPIDFHQLR
jgi:hypothetical protein